MRLMVLSFLLLTACASHKLRCDAHLQAINKPAPAPLSDPAGAAR